MHRRPALRIGIGGPVGSGKTALTLALCLALREPSMGPSLGLKGGATGGGLSQLVPATRINLHFTGDFHAIGAAHNLLAAMLDNHINHGNALDIDPRRVAAMVFEPIQGEGGFYPAPAAFVAGLRRIAERVQRLAVLQHDEIAHIDHIVDRPQTHLCLLAPLSDRQYLYLLRYGR